jgi:hypothetical protein
METSTGIINYHLKGCMKGGFLEITTSGRNTQGELLLLFGRIDKEAILNFLTSYPFSQGHQLRF